MQYWGCVNFYKWSYAENTEIQLIFWEWICYNSTCWKARELAQFGSALRSGRRGHGFESRIPDHSVQNRIAMRFSYSAALKRHDNSMKMRHSWAASCMILLDFFSNQLPQVLRLAADASQLRHHVTVLFTSWIWPSPLLRAGSSSSKSITPSRKGPRLVTASTSTSVLI